MSITDSLRTALAELAAVRADAAALNAAMHTARATFNEQHAPLIHAINDHAARLAEAETQVRALAVAAYDMDPSNKKPAPGADIAVRVTYSYDHATALAWARGSLPTAISEVLDTKVIDKIASTGALPFAARIETPSVRLGSDLSAYLIPEPALVAVESSHV